MRKGMRMAHKLRAAQELYRLSEEDKVKWLKSGMRDEKLRVRMQKRIHRALDGFDQVNDYLISL